LLVGLEGFFFGLAMARERKLLCSDLVQLVVSVESEKWRDGFSTTYIKGIFI
jgi:hypothetical protein